MGISVNPTALYNSTFMLPCFICKGGILCLGRVVDRHNRRDILRLTPVILLVRWILQGLILPTLILKLFSLK